MFITVKDRAVFISLNYRQFWSTTGSSSDLKPLRLNALQSPSSTWDRTTKLMTIWEFLKVIGCKNGITRSLDITILLLHFQLTGSWDFVSFLHIRDQRIRNPSLRTVEFLSKGLILGYLSFSTRSPESQSPRVHVSKM